MLFLAINGRFMACPCTLLIDPFTGIHRVRIFRERLFLDEIPEKFVDSNHHKEWDYQNKDVGHGFFHIMKFNRF
jgi:hypothetical protein